jgi:hypothetical protein
MKAPTDRYFRVLEDGGGLLRVLRVALGARLLDHALQLMAPALVSER